MSRDAEFESDDDIEVVSPVEGSALPMTRLGSVPADIVKFREELIRDHHKGAPSLLIRLEDDDGDISDPVLLKALVNEIIGESDTLLGNESIATRNGDLRDSSIISVKRADVLEKAIKAVQGRIEFDREAGIDVDSSAMLVIFKFFMSKLAETFEQLGTPDEMKDLFLSKLGELTQHWKVELREEFEVQRQRGK